MKNLYRKQLKKVLQLTYKTSMSDILDLIWAAERIELKSKDDTYKTISLEEIQIRLKELNSFV